MSAIVIRNLPDGVHDALREMARARRPRGIDFEELARRRKELGIEEDWPEWTEDMDDPAFSRSVLGLED